MDAERKIRFLYPPVFLLLALLSALWVGGNAGSVGGTPLNELSVIQLVGIAAGGGLALVASGVAIGAITHLLLRIMFLPLQGHFEASVSQETLKSAWRHVGAKGEPDREKALYVFATMAHEALPKSIGSWMTRRWHAFTICSNSSVALLLAMVIVAFARGSVPGEWYVVVALLAILLGIAAAFSWRDTMKMFEFQVSIQVPNKPLQPTDPACHAPCWRMGRANPARS